MSVGERHRHRHRRPAQDEAVGTVITGNRQRWWIAVAVLTAVALAVRLGFLFGWLYPMKIAGDAYYYHHAANMFVDGRGWPNPYLLIDRNEYLADAQHPPLTSLLLAVPSLFGLRSFVDHQVFSCLLGATSVVVVGLAGRRIAGPVTGLIAAAIAAVYPGMWLSDALLMSETPAIGSCALLILASYRLWDRRRPLDAVRVGAALAAAMLARTELALLALVLATPLVLRLPTVSWAHRLRLLGACGATCGLLIAPWVGYNLSRFEEPELISSGLGVTLAVTHCDTTYHGGQLGWWSLDCATSLPDPPAEASRRDRYYREAALRYIRANSGRLPVVAAARLGRTWAVYRPWQQAWFDTLEERPQTVSRIGSVSLWSLGVAGAGGVVVLWRRRVPVLPLLATPIVLSLASMLIYGTTRFRAAAEPSVVLLAAVGLGALLSSVLARRRRDMSTPTRQTNVLLDEHA
ncbi:glycosyltransferase family 39 protein [Frankia sp. R82]|uniref:ArnT family glycosyltransferase n=1 Tax=Frankia sp. R82 TaxID=2950553 RepID=UPI0020448A18|nr:glycosyltransferase family 39 protein [Frankia sp. R82]MCM3886801.1 glycosyltransferase family 39 protein [Frankia sp. R82]